MLLAVDVGNTQTALGLYDAGGLGDHWRLATERTTTADELGVLLGGLLDFDVVDGICLASTVPVLVREWEQLAEKWASAPLLVVGPGVKTGIPIRYDDPREVGSDRIVNSVAAKERYGAPVIVVDFGTSTNFDVVSAAGEYVGGVLAPGIEISMEALFARAARLVKVDYAAPPSVIGKTTVSCTGSRARWTESSSASVRSSAPRRLRSPPAGSPTSLRRTRGRSRRSIPS
jgi:type III pantothenate kinase